VVEVSADESLSELALNGQEQLASVNEAFSRWSVSVEQCAAGN